MKCVSCGKVSSDAVIACDACGSLLGNETVECVNHPIKDAAGICSICAAPICGECTFHRDGKLFCSSAHADLTASHTLLCSTSILSEAEVLAANLHEAGFSPLVIIPESNVFGKIIADRLLPKIFVPDAQSHEAMEKINELELTDFIMNGKADV